MMTKVLVIYQAVPEETMQFIVEADAVALADLKAAHNNYAGMDNDLEMEKTLSRINMRISGSGVGDSDTTWAGLDKAQVGIWEESRVQTAEPVDVIKEGVELVILTGYMM